ncbi:MAG TPA: TetR/AcrR family transcriptional regulator [Candidatus Cloacimonadota bacterium]|nr:TetR/AcrR family transcriptional regulator [Candidatus Cloacimonadota bacterium]HOV16847.1 TetR/AcrR family transcriptional regulator [Candidatus Cloacimonadota bacterium]HQL14505.1 TetR/AcrR family transcriptional regulator [Candidatus Cloacimonadota bacterium]
MLNEQEKKRQIIDAADNLFCRFGYAKTSLEDIAREAALGKGTIYYNFDSKEEIFFEVVKRHYQIFYASLNKELTKKENFADKFSTVIQLPLKLIYEHAPILLDAMKNLADKYMQKLCAFRKGNREKMTGLLTDILEYGINRGEVNPSLPIKRIVNIIFDWFLLGDSNIIIKSPEEFIKKAEEDYDLIVQIMLQGLLLRG